MTQQHTLSRKVLAASATPVVLGVDIFSVTLTQPSVHNFSLNYVGLPAASTAEADELLTGRAILHQVSGRSSVALTVGTVVPRPCCEIFVP